MATNYYTDQYSTNLLVRDPVAFQSPAPAYEERVKIAHLVFPNPTNLDAGDIILLGDFNSGDRIERLEVTIEAALEISSTVNIGFYNTDGLTIGSALDVDLFASATDWAGALNKFDLFDQAILDDQDRGKKIWELLALGAQTYTEDPFIDVTLAATLVGNPAVTSAPCDLKVYITTLVAL